MAADGTGNPKNGYWNFRDRRGRQGRWPGRYELLGRYLGMFHDKLDVSADAAIIEQVNRGRKDAAGITDQDDEQEEAQDNGTERKPD